MYVKIALSNNIFNFHNQVQFGSSPRPSVAGGCPPAAGLATILVLSLVFLAAAGRSRAAVGFPLSFPMDQASKYFHAQDEVVSCSSYISAGWGDTTGTCYLH